nr:long-chain fatty acid--CoA ligase [Mesobacillus harenae]
MTDLISRPWKNHLPESGRELPDFSAMGVYSLLERTAELYAEQTAIIFEEERLTYRQFKNKVDRLASALRSLGAHKGDRIGLMLPNHPLYIISYYAALKLGMIVVQINPMYTERELLEIFNDSKPGYLILQEEDLTRLPKQYSFKWIFTDSLPDQNKSANLLQIDKLIIDAEAVEAVSPINPSEDIAVIQYTGGTTGVKKGAMLTHSNLVANVVQSKLLYGDKMSFGEETVLAVTPLYHVYGMTVAMNLGIYVGAKILIVKKFEIENVLDVIKKFRPTFFPGVPKMYSAFVEYPEIEKFGLDCLKICSCGSAPLPVEIIKTFEDLTGAVISEGYGLSETSPTTHRNPCHGVRKVGSIGIPVPGTDCRIIDEEGNDLPVNAIGELLIKGPQVMLGYWGKEPETADAIKNGWFYTGDLAVMDEDGYFYIAGRKKEMIIVGGFNVYPQEIESVLYEYPDIQEAAVVGIPDRQAGEIVKAFIVPKTGRTIDLELLKEHCYRQLTRYKVPKQFQVKESLPRNSVGKLLKRLLVAESE